MIRIENVVNKSCSPNSIFLRENRFQEDSVNFWLQKLTLKTENAQFMMARHYFCLQDIKISFKDVNFYTKMSLILDTPSQNPTTQRTILYKVIKCCVFSFFLPSSLSYKKKEILSSFFQNLKFLRLCTKAK